MRVLQGGGQDQDLGLGRLADAGQGGSGRLAHQPLLVLLQGLAQRFDSSLGLGPHSTQSLCGFAADIGLHVLFQSCHDRVGHAGRLRAIPLKNEKGSPPELRLLALLQDLHPFGALLAQNHFVTGLGRGGQAHEGKKRNKHGGTRHGKSPGYRETQANRTISA